MQLNETDQLPFQLELLRNAENYQQWVLDCVKPFLGQRIFEVGSGIGNMSRWLPLRERLILSDIDDFFLNHLRMTMEQSFDTAEKVSIVKIEPNSTCWKNEIEQENIDTIISFNVLEHIEKDSDFLAELLNILKKSSSCQPKRLITFVPAHQFAFGLIDVNYGHFRRYNHRDFERFKDSLAPQSHFYYRYFNLLGLPGWVLSGQLLRQKEISKKSILYFEKLCPWVKRVDDFLHTTLRLPFGQSILVVITL